MGPPCGKLSILFPYHSHMFRDSYGSSMGIVWVPLTIFGGPMSLGDPENPIELIHPLPTGHPSTACFHAFSPPKERPQ